MITNRAQWLILLGVAGSAVGMLLNKGLLAHVSLAVLVWLFGEWLLFRWRIELQLRHLRCVRTVNGSTNKTGTLWTGRRVKVAVEIIPEHSVRIPFIRLRDWQPENLGINQADQPEGAEASGWPNEVDATISGKASVEFEYTCRPKGAGILQFRGVNVCVFDLQGLFVAKRFIPGRQRFRVLPTSVTVDATAPTVKRVNSLPPPGIHRLQRAGMGSELLELREYVLGDPPKAIAWKVSARRDQLMTREYESEVPIRTTLFVDSSFGTKHGEFGKRPLDQIVRLAASIAKSAMSLRDPVGLAICNDAEVQHMTPGAGDRHFFQMLDRLSERAVSNSPPPVRFTQALLDEAWRVCEELHPELLIPKINQVPFTWFPIRRGKRLERFRRTRLAVVLTELYSLPADQPQNLIFDNAHMASQCQRFLIDAGYGWTWPVVDRRRNEVHDWHGKFEVLTSALTRVVTRSHDHELFVLLVDLLDHPDPPGRLADAIRLARARHHRVVVICPCPDDCRPGSLDNGEVMLNRGLTGLLSQAERARRVNSAEKLQRTLRRLGVPVAFASDGRAVQLVLSEAELARGGRTSRAGRR
ncbi:MAG: DUF58 domain-containing protein [Planctomycetales bacterium]|jgi:uncharacterized protein (DUF58 family)